MAKKLLNHEADVTAVLRKDDNPLLDFSFHERTILNKTVG